MYATLSSGLLPDDDAVARVLIPTAPERVAEAVQATLAVLSKPVESERFERARRHVDQVYRSSRIATQDIPSQVAGWRRRGHDTDPRLANWARLPSVTQDEFAEFYRASVGSAPIITIVGDTTKIDLEALAEVGAIERVELGDISAAVGE